MAAKFHLMGNVVRDVEVRYTQDNKPVANGSIATQRNYKDKDGKYPTDFINFTAFGSTASFLEKYGQKGQKFLIEGEIRNNKYEKDGKTVYSNQFVVNSVEFAGSKSNNSPVQDNAPAQEQADGGFNEVPDATPDELPFV